jgi:hypothetical protein
MLNLPADQVQFIDLAIAATASSYALGVMSNDGQ